MTNQEIFDIICNHLITQNSKAIDEHGICKYRGLEGKKCAAGILIPDSEYSSEMEGKKAHVLGYFDKYLYSDSQIRTMSLIMSLQRIHDLFEVNNWKKELVLTAHEFNLTIPDCIKN